MFGGLGGEGTDQEGCLTQQVERVQYVTLMVSRKGNGTSSPKDDSGLDANTDTARAVAAAE
jgi:hypothetical protein